MDARGKTYLDELVESGSDSGAQDRSKPVDPVITIEFMDDDARAERSRGVEGTSGVAEGSHRG